MTENVASQPSVKALSPVDLPSANGFDKPSGASKFDIDKPKFMEEIEVPKVKLTITESRCRSGYFKRGQEYIVEDVCPPLCHELWNNIYPQVYALLNGAELDYGVGRAKMFDAKCPDECRVCIHGEILED